MAPSTRFELGPDGDFDQLSVQRPTEVFNTKLDLGQATLRLATLDGLDPTRLEPGEYQLLRADAISGTASLSIDGELRDVLDTSRLFTEGIVVVLGNAFDCNGDGVTSLLDANCALPAQLGGTLEMAGLLKGDLDGNGKVEFADFLVLSSNFAMPGQYTDGDFDKSGQVDFADFLFLSSNFGQASVKMATVPEPSTVLLAEIGLIGAFLGSVRVLKNSKK